MVAPSIAREIEDAVNAVLRTRSVEGKVVVREQALELHQGESVVAVDLGEWVDQWVVIPPDMRDRRALACAVRLEDAIAAVKGEAKPRRARASAPRAAASPQRIPGRAGMDVNARNGVLAVALLGVLGGAVWWFLLRAPEPVSETVDTSKADDTARVQRVCEAGRQQIYSGASMGVDSAGWVVELWLRKGKEQTFTAKELGDALSAESVSKALGNVPEGEVAQELKERTAILRFDGAFVAPFFANAGRQHFVSLAARLSKRLGAESAALYAKCKHLASHDVGAWFWGKDRASAATSLLYAGGLHAHPPAMKRELLKPTPLVAIERRVHALEDRALASAVTKAGGTLKARDAQVDPDGLGGTAIRFPFTAATRAGRASRALLE